MSFKDFATPPINESYMGFQYTLAPNEWNTLDYGEFYSTVRSDFPIFQEHDEIAPFAEGNQIMFGGLPPLRRVWLIKKDSRELLQIQRDRFLYNWRKIQVSDSYPRFENLSQSFKNYWNSFESYCLDKKKSKPQIQYVEFTYTNVIDDKNGFDGVLTGLSKITSFIDFSNLHRGIKGFNLALNLESKSNKQTVIQVVLRDGMNVQTKKHVLYIELKSVIKLDDKDKAFQWLDQIRLELRDLFCDLTAAEAHKVWGIKNESMS